MITIDQQMEDLENPDMDLAVVLRGKEDMDQTEVMEVPVAMVEAAADFSLLFGTHWPAGSEIVDDFVFFS